MAAWRTWIPRLGRVFRNIQIILCNVIAGIFIMMSTSQYSLATSADLRTISTNNSVLDARHDQYVSSQSPNIGPSTGAQQRPSVDFYEQVDERMSRNSFEYPTYQAKYVDRWLEEGATTARRKTAGQMSASDNESILNLDDSLVRDQWGKVIGIRGYPKDARSTSGNDQEQQSWSRRQYNKLKFDHTRLKSNHDKLKKEVQSMAKRFKHSLGQRDHEIRLLKELINRMRGRNKDGYSRDSDDVNLRRQLRELGDRLDANASGSNTNETRLVWQLEEENSNLKREIAQKQSDHEQIIKQLRLQVDQCQSEPNQTLLMKLKNENSNLKSVNECNRKEMETLKGEYQRIESELKTILHDQHKSEDQWGKEVTNMSLELSRLQVYQVKLESILETERAIKQELERQLDQSKRDQSSLKERLSGMNRNLIDAESRQDRASSSEVQKLQLELMRWQEKCDRLMREKSDISELLRSARCKVDQLENRTASEMERVLEANRNELDKLQDELKSSETNCTKLEFQLEETTKRLASCSEERDKLTSENLNLRHEIELQLLASDSMRLNSAKAKESEQQIEQLQRKLMQCESSRRDLERERDNNSDRLELARQQMDQLRSRFKLQQETFDKFKVAKEQELARLRVNLNFEHYNRQVALGSIEKELRHSLRELDSMKCRFIRRFGASSSSSATTPTQTTSTSAVPTPPAAATTTTRDKNSKGHQRACQCSDAAEIRDRRCSSRHQQQRQANVIEIGQQQQQRRQVNSSFGSGRSLSSSSCSPSRNSCSGSSGGNNNKPNMS